MGAASVSPARSKRRGEPRFDRGPTGYGARPDARKIFDEALQYQLAGRIDAAVQSYERALLVNPDDAEAHNNLGAALAGQGKFKVAIAHYERAVVLKPDYGEAHINTGVALVAQGITAHAIACFEKALALNPNHAGAHYNLAIALAAQGKSSDAAAHYERALLLKPEWAHAHNNLGNLLGAEGNPDSAVAHYLQALAIDPRHAEAHNNLGNSLVEEGKFDDALAHYDFAIAVNASHIEAHYHRAQLKKFRPDDPDLTVLKALVNTCNPPADKKIFAHFALAQAYEDIGDYGQAFVQLREGNALKRSRIHYDEAGFIAGLQRTVAAFDGKLFDRLRGEGDPSQAPIFVVGMPRSGSTLIEQILASHPRIYGAGELTALQEAASEVLGSLGRPLLYPECVSELDGAALRRIGQAYLERLPVLSKGKDRIVNKCLANFVNVGLIRLILPNARIIHVTRDPIDTCLSCYSKLFRSGVFFSYDLAELGRYHRGYSEMMNYWRAVLPADAMIEVSYEEVVNDLEGQARRLIDYCGLPWDERCLSFDKTERPVRTASALQVRRPLFRSSLQRWRRYEADLGPLLSALGTSPLPAALPMVFRDQVVQALAAE